MSELVLYDADGHKIDVQVTHGTSGWDSPDVNSISASEYKYSRTEGWLPRRQFDQQYAAYANE